MTEAYNPKVVEKAAQSFWDERDSFAAKESKKPKYYCFQCFRIRQENCIWVMLEIIRLGM